MSDHLSDVFRRNVEAALEIRGMSQYRLSLTLGLHPTTIQKLVRNPRNIGVTLTTVERVSQALGFDPLVMLTPGGVAEPVQLRRAS